MVKFDNTIEEEKLYDYLISRSFKSKSINDAKVLIEIFKKYEWGDTNYRMLEWVLEKNLENQKVNDKNRRNKMEIPSEILEERDDFIFNHMN